MIAAPMNTAVAAIERGDSRAMPQMPWPEVQPLPSRVPKPTNRPATAIVIMLPGICGIARLSPRSIAATLVFMIAAIIVVALTHHVIGG